ncbi:MAG: hypothetical protein F6J87_24740 [Spirulina sp. SIO3F2]|nr:hypothetical protein [Spirulina sp. SIO3F2]
MSGKKLIERPRGYKERLALADSLLSRPRPERIEKAKERFKALYPDASDEMISFVVFHVYVDGIQAALDWIASAEIFLQTGDNADLGGDADHLMYHLYNWHQFKALMPIGNSQIMDLVKEMKEALSEKDTNLMKELIECHLDDLEDAFNDHPKRPPNLK